jgi:hypothetical protein
VSSAAGIVSPAIRRLMTVGTSAGEDMDTRSQ